MIDGLIFDLDGTLWDSSQVVSESWADTLSRSFGAEHFPSAEDCRSIMGMTAAQIAQKLFSDFGSRAEEVCRQCILEENAHIAEHSGELYPGTEEMLRVLSARMPLFVVSNCLDGYIQCFLKVTGFGRYFRDFECEGRTGLPKAGNIRLIRERNGLVSPVYIGDTAGDEQSAAEAGCLFIHAAYGFGTVKSPVVSIAAPLDLIPAISHLEKRNPHV